MPSPTLDFSQLVNDIRIKAKKRQPRQEAAEVDAGIIEELHGQIKVLPVVERTFLVALAIHSNPDKNVATRLTSHGTPICGCGYDCVNDYYGVNCLDHLNLGAVPIAFKLSIEGNSRWEPFVPIPECVIMHYLAPEQKIDLESFKAVYDAEEICIEFLQMIE